MNTAAMNPAAAGGPVGGGMMMMNNGSPMHPAVSNDMSRINLNTYIYDYLLKHGHYEIAKAVLRDDAFEFRKDQKTSPGRRKAGDMNGDAGDGMDMDQKDDVPDELPRPANWDGSAGHAFLLEWFNVFSDLFDAARGRNGKPAAVAYMNYDKRLREQMVNQGMNRPGMNPALMQQRMNGMNGNMANQKMNPQQAQQMMALQKRNAAAQQMNREAGEGEMNGVRPGTPADGDAGGSPSKRARIDNGQQQFNNGMIQNGRPAGAAGAQNPNMPLIQAGFNPNMNPQFRQNGAMPPKGMQAGMQNGMNMGNAGSPMMAGMNPFPDGMNMNNLNLEYIRNQNMQNGQPGMQAGGGGAQSGNHALQDYQMQLMLLEQQNKKRLMMARQEQHENNPGGVPGVNMGAGMSPGGSRTGTSPNPAEAMAGRSPAAMNFMSNFQNDLGPQMFNMGDKSQLMGPGPGGMRPPTSADMNAVRQQPGARPGQFPGGHPMQQQGSQAGQIGTPGQREMPPPSAPATGGSAQRTQGASPSGNQAPPTPSQTSKPAPKNAKKGAANKDDGKRARPNKKGGNANAASGDDNQPVTPAAPSTPITPNNPGVMNANKGQPGMPQGNPQQANQGMQMNNQMQQPDMAGFGFGDNNDAGNGQFNLDFSTLESSDVLENFDFDSFLNTSADDAFNVDMGADFGADFGIGNTE